MHKSHKDTASELQNVGIAYHWKVFLEPNSIRLAKQIRDNVFSVTLLRNPGGMYDIQPFVYEFKSRISFFDYQTPENRYMRNKIAFMQFFNLMRRANMWDIISNRDTFIRVNDNCKYVAKHLGDVKSELKRITSEFDIVKKKEHRTVGQRPRLKVYENRKAQRIAA